MKRGRPFHAAVRVPVDYRGKRNGGTSGRKTRTWQDRKGGHATNIAVGKKKKGAWRRTRSVGPGSGRVLTIHGGLGKGEDNLPITQRASGSGKLLTYSKGNLGF